jgi:glycosyltransferase involved in cell wall biosynthesis
MKSGRALRILTWHVHGNYLYYLSQVPHEFYLPVKTDRSEGYGGRLPGFDWPDSVHDVPVEEVRHMDLDCILFQSRRNYTVDQKEILSPEQQKLPRIFLEHDPPREHPTDTRHVVDDPEVLLVHVTHFNDLMWDSGRTPTRVIEHGVFVPEGVDYTGEIERGLVVVNGLAHRGRRVGLDVFQQVRDQVPLDLVGMGSEELGGLGEIPHEELPAFEARYRFFFNPIRYTSLGLAVCEAMMVGMPLVGLATAEMVTAVENHVSGFVHTNIERLVEVMQQLLQDRPYAFRLSRGAQRRAYERFNMTRFIEDWAAAFDAVTTPHIGRTASRIRGTSNAPALGAAWPAARDVLGETA